MHRRKLRHMLLLEVLIALSIVLLCILPLLQPHVVMIQSEKDFIREVQLDRVVNQLFADLLINSFYNQRITWEEITSNREVPIASEAVKALLYNGKYQIVHQAPADGAANEARPFHLLEIQYTFTHAIKRQDPLVYKFNLFVQREQRQESTAEPPPTKAPEVNPGK